MNYFMYSQSSENRAYNTQKYFSTHGLREFIKEVNRRTHKYYWKSCVFQHVAKWKWIHSSLKSLPTGCISYLIRLSFFTPNRASCIPLHMLWILDSITMKKLKIMSWQIFSSQTHKSLLSICSDKVNVAYKLTPWIEDTSVASREHSAPVEFSGLSK